MAFASGLFTAEFAQSFAPKINLLEANEINFIDVHFNWSSDDRLEFGAQMVYDTNCYLMGA